MSKKSTISVSGRMNCNKHGVFLMLDIVDSVCKRLGMIICENIYFQIDAVRCFNSFSNVIYNWAYLVGYKGETLN